MTLASSRSVLSTTALLTLLCASPALAQGIVATTVASDASAVTSTNEIIVTARRTNERAQDVPIPLSVVSGENLEKTGAYTLADIQSQVPSMTAYNANPRNSSVGIRGIGVSSASDGLDTSVGFYIDGVYLGRPGMALEDLIDLDQFEVLRGPQGTLFGRNTSAGVINITTRKPSFDPGATVEVSGGNYNYNQERISLTGPLIPDLLAFRLTGFNTHRDGVLDNTKTGTEDNSVGRSGARLQLLATPAPNFTLRLIGEYSNEDDTCCVSVLRQTLPNSIGATTARMFTVFNALGYTPTPSLDSTQINSPQDMLTDQHAFSLEADWDLGWAKATSISAYRYWHFHPLQDSDSTPLDIIQINVAQTRDKQFSQEFRLASNPGRFNWQAGAYLFHQDLRDHFILNQFGYDASAFYTLYNQLGSPTAPAVNIAPGSQYLGDTHTQSDSLAGFGQANFQVTDRFILTGGVRYTWDDRKGISDTSTTGTPYLTTSIPFHYNVEVKGGNWSYLGSASYKLATDILAYVSYSTGYKAAGLNLNSAVSPTSPLIVQPEKTKNWELGLKSELFEHRLTLNLSAYSEALTGLQSNIALPGLRSYLANVGDVSSRGGEVEAILKPDDHFDLGFNTSYNDAHYTSYSNAPCPVGVSGTCNLTGRPLFQAPKWLVNGSLRYHFNYNDRTQPYFYAQYSYRTSSYGSVDDSPYVRIPSYALVNGRIGTTLAGGKYDVSLWVNNLFDKKYFQSLSVASIVGAAAYGTTGQLGTPRTFGATVRANF